MKEKTLVRRLDGVPELYQTSRNYQVANNNDFPQYAGQVVLGKATQAMQNIIDGAFDKVR